MCNGPGGRGAACVRGRLRRRPLWTSASGRIQPRDLLTDASGDRPSRQTRSTLCSQPRALQRQRPHTTFLFSDRQSGPRQESCPGSGRPGDGTVPGQVALCTPTRVRGAPFGALVGKLQRGWPSWRPCHRPTRPFLSAAPSSHSITDLRSLGVGPECEGRSLQGS